MAKKTKVKVHETVLINKELLSPHKSNSNKQSRHVFSELRKSIRENGFDETLIVVPKEDSDEYSIISGSHRFKAGMAEGVIDFPCIVHEDWGDIAQQIEIVRRNFVRGKIDKDTFTINVNALAAEQDISLDEIQDLMGFEDTDIFMEFYKEENERLEKAHNAAIERKTSAPQVQMIDDLGLVLSAIFAEYGDSMPYSFLIFPAGGKQHMFVAATTALVKNLTTVAEYCISNSLDINLVLGGLLTIGLDASSMVQSDKTKEVVEKGSEGLNEEAEFSKIEV